MTVSTMEKKSTRRRATPPPAAATASGGRGWLWALGQTALVGVMVFAILFLLAQPAFRPKAIQVSGVHHQTVSDVVSALAVDGSRSIFFLGHSDLEQRVSTLPWVESAAVQVALPDRVEVQVTEWSPVAVLQVGELSYYLNEQGMVLGPASEAGRLVILNRIHLTAVKPGDPAVSGELLQMLIALQAGFYPAFKLNVASFELDEREVLTLRTQRGWTVTFGQMVTDADRASLEPKLAALRALAGRLDLTTAPLEYINLMNPRAPAVQLRPR
jgi:cell division septal protein FtsQ